MPPETPSPLPHALTEQVPAAQTPAAALWRIREYLRPYYFQLILSVIAALVAVTARSGTGIAESSWSSA